ncbi:MAG: hypothetical protein ACI32C_03310 [Candidatus Enteromonas sp.]
MKRPNGGKLTLKKTIKKNYKIITEPLLEVKSAFIAVCADIDRYIRISTGCEIREELDEATVGKLKEIFPCLSEMTVDQWNRLILVFLNIRNDNAHLYQNKPVYIDEDILAYLNALVEPEMDVVADGNELTVYGAYYVLVFLSQRFQLWTFITPLLRGQNFDDMSKKEFHDFQISSQHLLQEYCGTGKPIGNNGGTCMTHLMHINDTLRRELTSVFIRLEVVAIDRGFVAQYSPSFRTVISNIEEIEEGSELSKRLIELRNTWFHGHWLEDEVVLPDGKTKKFDFYETIDTLRMLRETLVDYERYDSVTSQIESFGKALLDFKVQRLVEVSYKLLDSRLLTASKFDERIDNLGKAYSAFASTDERFLEAAASLLGNDPVVWKISAAKFSNADSFPRKTITSELRVIILVDDNGFDIGGFHTDRKTLTLCDVDLPPDYCNTINGKPLKDYKLIPLEDVCRKIKLYTAM